MVRFRPIVSLVSLLALALLPLAGAFAQEDDLTASKLRTKPTTPTEKPAEPKWVPGSRMVKAVTRVMEAGIQASTKIKYGFDSDLCVLGAFIQNGKAISFSRRLEAGKKYAFIGAGDDNAEDIDIVIKDADGNQVAEDSEDDAKPAAIFACDKTGTYTVRLELPKAEKAAFCALAFMVENAGFKLPEKDVVTAAAGCIAVCNQINDAMKGEAVFNDAPNQWAFYGTILKQDESIEVSNIRPGTGKCVFIAAGDKESSNIDLIIKDADGKDLDSDEKDDAFPMLVRDSKKEDSFRLKIRNTTAKGPALIFATVLRRNE